MHILAQAMDGEKPRAEISRVLAASNRGVRSLYRLFRTDHMDRVIELSVPEVDGEYGEVQLSGLQVSEYTPQRLLEEAKTMGVI
jgi:ATP-dependent 26S proteasome regulatory subunit